MLPHSTAFSAALDKQIRRAGTCEVKITFSDSTEYTVDQYKVESVETFTKNDPLSRRFPEEGASVVLIDFEEAWNPDAPNNIISKFENPATATIRFGIDMGNGTTEWCSICKYHIVEKPTWSKYRATIKMVRRLGSLSGTFYQFEPDTQFVKGLADSVFTASGDTGSHVYDTNLSVYQIYKHQYIPVCSIRDALLTIAAATKSCLLTDWTGAIHIVDRYLASCSKHYSVVKARDMYERPSADRIPKIRNEIVKVMRNPETEEIARTVLDYSSNDDPDGSQFYQFDAPVVVNTISYSGSENVSNSAFLTYNLGLVPMTIVRTDPSQPYRVVVSAKPRTPKSEMKTYVIDANGQEDETFENGLVNKLHSGDLALYRGRYLKNTRSLYSINYRGDPTIEALDLIRVELPFEGVQTCIVLEATFRYSAGFSGTLIVRKLDEVATAQTIESAVSDQAVSDEATSDEDS